MGTAEKLRRRNMEIVLDVKKRVVEHDYLRSCCMLFLVLGMLLAIGPVIWIINFFYQVRQAIEDYSMSAIITAMKEVKVSMTD